MANTNTNIDANVDNAEEDTNIMNTTDTNNSDIPDSITLAPTGEVAMGLPVYDIVDTDASDPRTNADIRADVAVSVTEKPAWSPSTKVANVIELIAGVDHFDKKAIAQIVKAAIALRTDGKATRERAEMLVNDDG